MILKKGENMKKYLKKQVASVALSMAIAGSSAAAMSTPVYAAEEDANLKQAEQSIDEEAKEENPYTFPDN